MEDVIQTYLSTVMFRGTPCMFTLALKTSKLKLMVHIQKYDKLKIYFKFYISMYFFRKHQINTFFYIFVSIVI